MNINGTKEKPKLVRESLAFFKAVFDKENYGCLDEVCSNGCHLVVHMTDNYGSMQVISAVVFAIMPCGIWINFLASKSAKFLGTHYSNGDNIPFDKRGLGLFMIKQLYHLAVQLEDKRLISSAKIYLKTPEKRNQTTQEKSSKENPQQMVSRFYKKIGFKAPKKLPPDLLKFCEEKGGQSVDFQVKDKDVTASELLMLDSEPWRKYTSKCHMRDEVLCDKAIAKVVMNKDGSGRSKRSKSHGNLMNEKTEEISRYLARAYKIADSKVGETYHALKDYGLKLKDVFQGEDNQPLHKPPFALEYLRECTNQEGDNILFSDLMIQYKPGNAQQFESMISNICSFKFWDASEFASTCNNDLCLDTAIGVGSLSRLMPGSWFTGDLIKVVVDFIFRRKNSEIHNIAVLHDYVLDPIFRDNYFSTEDILKERFCEASIRVLKNAKKQKDLRQKNMDNYRQFRRNSLEDCCTL